MTFFNLPLSADIAVFTSVVFCALIIFFAGVLLAAYCVKKQKTRRERATRPLPQILTISGAPSMMSAISCSTPKPSRNNSCFVHCPSPQNKPSPASGNINPAFHDDFVSVIVDF
jgi:hypothetical protein